MAGRSYFSAETFRFLRDLTLHNDREWFGANKDRYDRYAKEPMLALIADLGPGIAALSSYLHADPRPVGGSMMRIHRDTRFSKDKAPYKTNLAAQFGHTRGNEEASPAFHFAVHAEEVFVGAGLWRPGPRAVLGIRKAIVARPDEWGSVTQNHAFRSACDRFGESLKRPPAGFDPNHPLVEDLKRKDFLSAVPLSLDDAMGPELPERLLGACARMSPFLGFLTRAVGLPY